jgi:predicted DNA-binding ribbon-helix-helix protein
MFLLFVKNKGIRAIYLCRPSRNGAFDPNLRYKDNGGGPMKSTIVKRSIVINGHKTSVSLEDAFWKDLKQIAHAQGASLGQTVAEIDETRRQGNLSSAIRLFVLDQIRNGTRLDQSKGRDRVTHGAATKLP